MNDKILLLTSRTLAILAILFMILFSIDCFEGSYMIKEKLICFGMHNIPTLILMLILILAWRRELAGGILFLLFAVEGSFYFRAFNGNPWVLIILLPFVLTGILFILHHVLYKKQSK